MGFILTYSIQTKVFLVVTDFNLFMTKYYTKLAE